MGCHIRKVLSVMAYKKSLLGTSVPLKRDDY